MEIISRKDAHLAGLKHYFTGKPCRRGHLRERSVSTGACLGCLAHYARSYASKFRGDVAHMVHVDPAHIAVVEQFVSLLSLCKTRGTQIPIVPTVDEVPTVNTLIKMSRPAEVVHLPEPAPAPVVDARHAMWVRIHGQEIADQMIEAGL